MAVNWMERLFSVTVSEPVVSEKCLYRTGYFKYAPEDSYTCIESMPVLVERVSVLGGIFSWEREMTTKDDNLHGAGRMR